MGTVADSGYRNVGPTEYIGNKKIPLSLANKIVVVVVVSDIIIYNKL